MTWFDISVAKSAIAQHHAKIVELPVELFPHILQYLELKEMFAVALACKGLYSRVMERSTLTWSIRRAMTNPDGALRWMYPVRSWWREWDMAYEAMLTWVSAARSVHETTAIDVEGSDGVVGTQAAQPSVDRDATQPKRLPLFDHDFPLLPFLRVYYWSDAMRSRRRRWRIIKQFDTLWTDYRRDGWERDVFVPPGTTWTEVNGDLTCSHS